MVILPFDLSTDSTMATCPYVGSAPCTPPGKLTMLPGTGAVRVVWYPAACPDAAQLPPLPQYGPGLMPPRLYERMHAQ